MKKAVVLIGLVVLLSGMGSAVEGAIVRRHDRADEDYLALGTHYPAVAKLGGRMGDGTLVAPRWVLTAAHIADAMKRRGSSSVRFGDREYRVEEIFIHPEWAEMGPHDFALVRLDREVEGIEPLALYDGEAELGAVAVMIGHGRKGDGLSGPLAEEDGLKRGATNRIEEANDRFIVFRFDRGSEATELEGIPAGGDSGGPAVLEIDGVEYVAGVSSLGQPGENGPSTYGAHDYFGRVSTHLEWIRSVLSGAAGP